jgi:hypothetical protein
MSIICTSSPRARVPYDVLPLTNPDSAYSQIQLKLSAVAHAKKIAHRLRVEGGGGANMTIFRSGSDDRKGSRE